MSMLPEDSPPAAAAAVATGAAQSAHLPRANAKHEIPASADRCR